jgi:hypothetical protein
MRTEFNDTLIIGGGLGHVRFGSKADICTAIGHVRFTPKSTHSSE